MFRIVILWEVLNGVGVDGVGGIFPFFFFCFFVFLRFSSLFFVFLRFSLFFFLFLPTLLGQGQTTAIYWENGEFHSDPVCTDPVRNLWNTLESTICPETLTESICFRFLRCKHCVTAPELCWIRTASGPFLENDFHPP